jgi:tetratricopeptide (TPR) repeat protein
MEGRIKEKDLPKKKVIFMTYTYNRLTELFSAQFMTEPAIVCCEQSLAFSRIISVSPFGIPNALLRLGMQYDKNGKKELAKSYYEQAFAALPDTNNLVYRDIISIMALCDYQLGMGIEKPLATLNRIISMANTESERLARLLTVGDILCEAGLFDSALFYLEPVFEKNEDMVSRIQAANYLRIIYDSLGDWEKSAGCMRFLADYKKSEGENKAMVSKLEDMFKDYTNRKQQKQAEEERVIAVRRAMIIVIPITLAIALTIFFAAKRKGMKMLKKQQTEADKMIEVSEIQHKEEMKRRQEETEQRLEETERKHQQKVKEIVDRHEEELRMHIDLSAKEIEKIRKRHEEELESERLAYRKEQEALRKSLKQHEERVKELETKYEHHHSEIVQQGLAFSNEPICRKIKDSISNLHLTARSNYGDYYYVKLDETDSVALGEAVAKHFPDFRTTLYTLLPKMDNKDLLMCYLYLLHLNNQQIAVLQQCHNSTIHRRSEQLQRDLNTDVPLPEFVRNLAFGHA